MEMEQVEYGQYGNCYKLSNDNVEVLVTADMGPRIIAYRFIGGTNILGEMSLDKGEKTDLGEWKPMGGHRLWHAPEAKPRSYVPDNDPVKIEKIGKSTVRATPPMEKETQIQKQMYISVAKEGTEVTIDHILTNKGLWHIELAPWALTIMNPGGKTIIPQEPFKAHKDGALLPARPMVLWPYTDLSDPRWTYGKKFLMLSTDSNIEDPQKVGVANKQGWGAYLREDQLFVKRFSYVKEAKYPDLGCNFETFTAGDFMEVETVGPMVTLNPGESVTHVEHWFLFQGVEAGDTEDSLEKAIMPLVKKTDVKKQA